jgi:hypothetical protein
VLVIGDRDQVHGQSASPGIATTWLVNYVNTETAPQKDVLESLAAIGRGFPGL